jgi:hypothetical protein
MSVRSDFTKKIDRFELFEERAGVTLEHMSAVLKYDEENELWNVTVLGELHPRTGNQLDEDEFGSYTMVYATAHDGNGRMLGQKYEGFQHDSFFGFEPFEIELRDMIREPVRIRVYPK